MVLTCSSVILRLLFRKQNQVFKRYSSSFSYKDGKPQSYYHRVGTKPLISATYNQVFDANVQRFPDRTAVVDRSRNIRKTYQQLYIDIELFAGGLLNLKCNPGDRIAVWGPNKYEWIVAQLAAFRAGLILVPLNSAFQPPEVDYCLKKMGVKTLVTSDVFKTQNYYKMIASLVPEIENSKPDQSLKSHQYPNLNHVIMMSEHSMPGTFKFNDVSHLCGNDEKHRLIDINKNIRFDDALYVILTSGTTGRPKGVIFSHIGLMNTSYTTSETLKLLDEHHSMCCFLPLFHAFGMYASMGMFSIGVTVAIPSPDYNPTIHLQTIEEEKCSVVIGTPTMLLDLVTHPKMSKTNVSTVKSIFVGGAPTTPDLIQKLHSTFHNATTFGSGYGLSEGQGMTSIHATELGSENFDSVGRVINHIEVKVVDANDQVVPMGTAGEICSRGYHVMKGYWEDEEKTKEVTKDGWLHSGDIGTLNEDGFIRLLSRKSDMIIRGGTNIYPKEIEDLLVTHPKIIDAQVIGVPDKRLGEEVCVWVKLTANEIMTQKELQEFCRGKISHFKIPKFVRFVKDFPRTASGKVYKLKMRQEENKIRD